MKKIFPLVMLLAITVSTAQAQLFKKRDTSVKKEYSIGSVTTINNKVTFEETIPAEGLTAKEIEEVAKQWFAERFVKPTIIGFKAYDAEKPNTLVAKAEEYIVFRNTFLVLNRARIYYYLTLTAKDGACGFNMSRITYWHDDESENGGIHLIAEEWITDETVIDKNGELKKYGGKFRRKTIDLKEQLVNEIKNALNSK